MMRIDEFRGAYRFLRNFHPSPIKHNRLMWPTVEHYYQAKKACTDGDYHAIREAETPGDAKRLGDSIIIRPDWEFIKTSIMLDAVRMKFAQNPELAELLVNTGIARLREGNMWHDNFWGDCDCPKCNLIIGENTLGLILMLVREELRP